MRLAEMGTALLFRVRLRKGALAAAPSLTEPRIVTGNDA